MLRVFVSTRVEDLASLLCTKVRLERSDNPLKAPWIWVPSRNVEAYAKHQIAEQTGIAANLNTEPIEQAIVQLVEQGSNDLRVLTAEHLRPLLASVLLQPGNLVGPEIDPLRGYLEAVDSPEALNIRVDQLSHRLADLFLGYGLHRKAMLASWSSGDSTAHSQTEAWQREIWRALFDSKGYLQSALLSANSSAKKAAMLPFAVESLVPKKCRAIGSIHLFAITWLAPTYLQIIKRIAADVDVFVYAFSPCTEFWEDVNKQGDDHPGLRWWGRAGRDVFRALNEATDGGLSLIPSDESDGSETVLSSMQQDIERRVPSAFGAPITHDPLTVDAGQGRPVVDQSVLVLSCPTARREAEAVAQEIWRAVRLSDHDRSEAGPLRFNQISVLLPDKEKERYLVHLTAAFREHYKIPYTIGDQRLVNTSRVAEAITMLIELPLGSFTRDQMLRLMIHPVVSGRYAHANPEQWREWAEQLNVLFGHDDSNLQGSYLSESDVVSWEQGIRRLVLGAFLQGERSGDNRTYEWGGRLYLPAELDSNELDSMGAFVHLARSLIADSKKCLETRLSLRQWAAYFEHVVGTYIHPQNDEDDRHLVPCVEALNSLISHDVTGELLPYQVAYAIARDAIADVERTRGQALAEGVCISSFLSDRAVPARMVVMMGMSDGQFPAPSPNDPLDLRRVDRWVTDISSVEEQRYSFLHSLMCTREKLVLSYIRINPTTGDEQRPGAVLSELIDILRCGYKDPLFVRYAETRHEDALRAWQTASRGEDGSVSELDLLPVQAIREAQASLLRGAISADVMGAPSIELIAERSEKLAPALRERFLPAPIPDAGHIEHAESVTMSLGMLRRFLECPLQGSAQIRLGLSEYEEEDSLQREEETFEASMLDRLMLLREVFWLGHARLEEVLPCHDNVFARASLAGRMPLGVFSEAERRMQRRILDQWCTNAHVLVAGGVSDWSVVHIGRAPENEHIARLVGPIVVPLKRGQQEVTVKLFGPSDPASPTCDASMVLAMSDSVSGRHRLRSALTAMLLAATGIAKTEIHRAFINHAGKVDPTKQDYAALLKMPSQQQAMQYLQDVVSDLYAGSHDYLLPVEVAETWLKAREEQKPRTVNEIVSEIRASARPMWSSKYGPIRRLDTFGTPDEPTAERIIKRRYEPLFDLFMGAVPSATGEAPAETKPKTRARKKSLRDLGHAPIHALLHIVTRRLIVTLRGAREAGTTTLSMRRYL